MTDRLSSEESLVPNESLRSANGQFSLLLQQDGNLVLYEQETQPVWATGTDGQEIARATMQQDGNLVLYTASGQAAWASETDGNEGAYLVVQDDRNVVIYSAADDPLWATNTST
jgi:hypothetical protein